MDNVVNNAVDETPLQPRRMAANRCMACKKRLNSTCPDKCVFAPFFGSANHECRVLKAHLGRETLADKLEQVPDPANEASRKELIETLLREIGHGLICPMEGCEGGFNKLVKGVENMESTLSKMEERLKELRISTFETTY